ncbi:MAG: zinc-dependent metalloprotease, partial [Prevotellaceae bacterium]|nr:zinc-dependent metalloprotease [Prevotellaceae bacterium]
NTGLPNSNYQSVKYGDGNTVYVPYKAVVNGQTDNLKAVLTFANDSLKQKTIVFKTLSAGVEIPATKISDTEYSLQLQGAYDYAEDDVIAVMLDSANSTQNQQVIGSFKLVHLSAKTINVTLVPTDNASKAKLENLKSKTNEIYAKIGITINFNEDEIFDITPYLNDSNVISTEDNTALSTYSAMQQRINSAYGDKNSDRYVLFVTGRQSSTGQMGYMRLGGRFGYVFGSATDKTAAHELGHGIFKLEHVWNKQNTQQNATPLLMDYSNGTQLSHLDWKQINDPALRFYAFQGQSEGESNSSNIIECIPTTNFVEINANLYKTFITTYTEAYRHYQSNADKESEKLLNKFLYIKINDKVYKTNSVATIFGRDNAKAYIGRFQNVFEIDDFLEFIIAHSDYVFYDVYMNSSKEECVLRESVGFNKLLDYKWELYRILKDYGGIQVNDLVSIDGVVYNANEIGNYVWGMVLTYHGIMLKPNWLAEKGTKNRNDEFWEQRAIMNGKNKADNMHIDKNRVLQYRLEYFRLLYEDKDKSWRILNPFKDLEK